MSEIPVIIGFKIRVIEVLKSIINFGVKFGYD